MKLHLVEKGAEVYIKKIGTNNYIPYRTKEDKTYFMEQFSSISTLNNNVYANAIVQGKKVTFRTDHFSRVEEDGYEMIVPNCKVNFFVNIKE